MFSQFFKRTRQPKSSRLSSRWRPRLELLEDRFMPAVRTWDGGALSNNWTNANNWVGNIAPVAGDDLIFPAGNFDKTADNDFANGTSFRSITLGGGYTLKGNRVFVGVGGIIDNSGTSNIIKNDLDLGVSGSGSRNFQLGAGSTLFLDGVLQGGNGFNKLGSGNLSLRANNAYEGITDIKAGALFIEKDESLGGTLYGTNIQSGATLVINDQAIGTIRTNEPLFVLNNGIIRGINDVEVRGTITTFGTTFLKHDGSVIEEMNISGAITGAGGINVIPGSGKVDFTGNELNNYQGVTTVAGELALERNLTAIPGNLSIISGGLVRLELANQINNLATVSITGTGRFELNGFSEQINNLNMVGGSLQTKNSSFVGLIFDGLQELLYGEEGLIISNAITLTSFSSSLPAKIEKSFLFSNASQPAIVVNDGPATNDAVFEGTWLEEVSYAKRGAGVLLDQSGTPFHYDITVEEGTLQLGYDRKASNYTVQNGAKFVSGMKIGTLAVNAGGRVHPGTISSTGILSLEGGLTMEPGAILEAVFNGTNAGSQHDQIDVDGTVNVDGAILQATLGSGAAVGQTYKLINNNAADSIVGVFFVPPATSPFLLASPSGQRLAFNYGGGTLNNDLVLTLQNTPPMAPDLALNTTEINEGGTVTATGRLVDPDTKDKLRLFVNWGDGTRQELHRPGRDLFKLNHRYRQNGVYTARFEWLDQDNEGNSREFTITVNNVPPTLTLRTFRTFSSGVLLANGWIGDSGNDLYTTTIDYGDGSPIRSNTLQRRNFFAIAHRYQNAGTYIVSITLRDALGVESVFQRQVRID